MDNYNKLIQGNIIIFLFVVPQAISEHASRMSLRHEYTLHVSELNLQTGRSY